jgi:hypothetical protein
MTPEHYDTLTLDELNVVTQAYNEFVEDMNEGGE